MGGRKEDLLAESGIKKKINDDIWTLIDGSTRKPWTIQLVTTSEDCPHKYRKWKPVRKGFFCKLLKGAKCTNEMCKLKVRN